MTSMQIGVDLAKTVFEVAVSPVPGQVHERRRLSRTAFGRFFVQRPPAEVLLEACGSAHHWGRELQRLGHRVTLLHPRAVAPYRTGNKTDRADARALLEAARNEKIRPVPALLRPALQSVLDEIRTLEAKAEAVRTELTHLAAQMPDAQRLLTVPGIGVLTATALVAFVGAPGRFRSGRHFAAYLGLTPREYSSGPVRRLGAITKHGNSYVRMLLVHGARSALRAGTITRHPDDLRTWASALAARKGHNVAAVALANKLAPRGAVRRSTASSELHQ